MATDDLEVTSVKLKLTRQSDGTLIEEGRNAESRNQAGAF